MKTQQMVRYQAGTLGRLGAAPAALPTQAGSGSGWIMVVVTAPPNAAITWQQTGGTNPSMMLVDQPPTGGLQEIAAGVGDNGRAFNFIGENQTYTFYLLPMDSSGNTYAPVEQIGVQGAPGIYASPSVPPSVLAATKAANPGLQVYSSTAAGATPPPSSPWYDENVSVFGQSVPLLALLGVGAAGIYLASGKR